MAPSVTGRTSSSKEPELAADLEQDTRFRDFTGTLGTISRLILGAIPVCGIIYVLRISDRFGVVLLREQYLGLFLTLVLISTFLNVPATKHSLRNRLPWYDLVLAFISVGVGGYLFLFYPELMYTMGRILPANVILGSITVLLVLEACRRLFGYVLLGLGLFFVLYGHLSYLLPGIFASRGIPWARLFTFLYLDSGALLGVPLYLVSTVVFAFMLFGRCLFAVGGGQFVSDIAMGLMGKYRGGPAKVAVIASALFGSISGSASANVATTGIITIPLMKKIGYSRDFAAAVEATASTGGLLLPPVMGAVAFIVAEFLEISYSKVAIAAATPAILFYIAVFLQVHLRAMRTGLKGLPSESLPSVKKVIKRGWAFVFPMLALIYFLFVLDLSAELCAIYTSALALFIGLFTKEGRISAATFLSIFVSTGRTVLEVAIICAIAGFISGSFSITGTGLSLSNTILIVSGGNTAILLIMAAITSFILGMGMPLIATYLLLVILIAPALVQSGIQPLAAHLFIMYFGTLSFLTPPVCISAYVAAGIANSNPMRTGFQAVRLGIVAYMVPFVFVYAPSLLLMGTAKDIAVVVSTALLGIVSLAIGLEGYLFNKIGIATRMAFGLSGLMLILPIHSASLAGLLLAGFLSLWEYFKGRSTRR
jgi:TRAP transporter 4TM/12TM fusion protein